MERECAYFLKTIGVKNFIDRYRWTVFVVLGLIFVLLFLVHMYVLRFDCGILFGSCYHSWLEPPLLLALGFWSLALLFTTLILHHRYPALNKAVLSINFIAGLTVLLATVFYHMSYSGHPQKQVFFDYGPVTPFHLQLSDIFFTYTLLLNLVLLLFSGPRLLRVISSILPPLAILIIHLMK
jgi:hypothetical protein